MTRCLLFDLGGTLWDDWPAEKEYWRICAGLLTEAGIAASLDDFIRDSVPLIHAYCPSLTKGLLMKYCSGDKVLAQRIREEAAACIWDILEDDEALARLYPLWPSVHETLAELSEECTLAVVSMHGSRVRGTLQRMGLAGFFSELALCDEAGLYKPDPRIIMKVVNALGADPQDCVMIGDRIDNDVWPANSIGMRSAWIPAAPYDIQQPRYEMDIPDMTLAAFSELPLAMRERGWL